VAETPGLALAHGAAASHAQAARREALELAERGEARAMLLVADILREEQTDPPFDAAASFLRQAAAHRLPEAMVRLHELLTTGLATPQGLDEARELFQRAAALGHPRARAE